MNLKEIVEDPQSPGGRAFFIVVQLLIVVSLISFSIETVPTLGRETRFWLHVIETVTVAVFTIEYAVRVLVADDRLRFILSFYGLIDLLAILPFYVSTGVDLRVVRILRFFRIFRAFKILRYTKAIRRFRDAFFEVRQELILYAMATVILIYLSAVGIYYFENELQPEVFGSVFDCLWWSIVTLTTVGYGDAVPQTAGGRVFTGFVLLLGVGTVAIPSALLAAALTKR